MSLDHPLILPVAIGLIALVFVTALWLRYRPDQINCKDPLFTPEFHAFLGQLDIAVRSHLIIFPAMPVHDVLEEQGNSNTLLRKFKKERFDFVVCHRREMDVLCVIKLGGTDTRNKKYRKLCESAGLALLEYDIKPYRDVPSLRREVFGACGIDEFELPISSVEATENSKTASPACPKCLSSMTLKTITKGSHSGEECWICSQYPECKGARLNRQEIT